MRQFDLITLPDGTFALILQSDLLDRHAWRVAAPLVPAKSFTPTPKLHLSVRIAGRDYIVVTDKLASISNRSIGKVVGSMRDREWDIRRALDLIFVGV